MHLGGGTSPPRRSAGQARATATDAVAAAAFAAKLFLGELAEEGLLASQRVRPKRLLEAGFEFAYPELEGALRRALAAREPD